MNAAHPHLSGAVEVPAILSTEPYISPDYARNERDRLWCKIWQIACREEEIPNVGDFYTYEVQDQSIIVLRSAEDEIRAFHNACPHRGRRITRGCGRARHLFCAYHGWQWDLQGRNTHVLDREDWGGALGDDDIALGTLKVARWAGFVFVNPDPACEPLERFLEELPYWLDPFEIGRMRYKWRKRIRYAANWKVVVEAFIEGYHSIATHPQVVQFGSARNISSSEGRHARMHTVGVAGGGIGTSFGQDELGDIRALPYRFIKMAADTMWSGTTDTFLEAARRLPELLPEGISLGEVNARLMEEAFRIDRERGVDWPDVSAEHMANVGINWHLFPNTVLLPNVTYLLGFRVLPDGFDPDSCIMEVYALERYPEGQEPASAWEELTDTSSKNWPLLLRQDFKNMDEIQRGMKSRGLAGLRPNPVQEASVINFQRNLAAYMGTAAPRPLGAD